MITGDNAITSIAVGVESGIIPEDNNVYLCNNFFK